MWPSHAGNDQHVQQMVTVPVFAAQPYIAPQDAYSRATAAGFDGWAVPHSMVHMQHYPGSSYVAPHHLVQPHMLPAGHGMAHHFVALPQHHPSAQGPTGMPPVAGSPASSPAMMLTWMPPPPGIVPTLHPLPAEQQGLERSADQPNATPWLNSSSSTRNGSSGNGKASYSSRAGLAQTSYRGGRAKRNIVLNTRPGDYSDAAVEDFAWSVRRTPVSQRLDPNMLASGLANLDSRGLAALLKELAKGHHGKRAREVFDFLRGLPGEDDLAALCDVFTYTAMISLCVEQQELARALELVSEMRQRNVERNVHTYTALMNVAIKCNQLQKALEIYSDMLREGCTPNVVTYNTLIDVYGKTGQWGEALRVVDQMHSSPTKPVTRTYNTLMIACNTSGQWHEALNVYNEMRRMGHAPNTTTYNALISAHSKAGRLEKVMEVYQEMLRTSCERSVITYSALISACEKAGQWQLALDLFSRMLQERCSPNVITYNSLITACAQGAQWVKAAEVFESMQSSGCKPDVVTYTALVSAYERGGQYVKALEVFQQMQQLGCSADAILYNTLLDVLWDTGVPWAQHTAAWLLRQAMDEGHFRRLPQLQPTQHHQQAPSQQQQQRSAPQQQQAPRQNHKSSAAGGLSAAPAATAEAGGLATKKLELGLQGMSPGVTMLMLHCWLADIREYVLQNQQLQHQEADHLAATEGQPPYSQHCLPDLLLLSTGRSRQRDHISGILRDSIVALLASWRSPFAPAGSEASSGASSGSSSSSKLEASGPQVEDWLLQSHICQLLEGFESRGRDQVEDIEGQLAAEAALATKCQEVFAELKRFESTHNLNVLSMGQVYTVGRAQLVDLLLEAGQQLCMRDDLVHDAVLLMDRAMSASFKVSENDLASLAAACLHLTSGSAQLGPTAPSLSDICSAMGCSSSDKPKQMTLQLQRVLKDDTSAMSALRCLRLYLERLGCRLEPGWPGDGDDLQGLYELIVQTLKDTEFLNYRPTITAAAVLYCERLQQGRLPFWPSSLAVLTGYSNARTPELAAAINGAQRLCKLLSTSSYQHGGEGRSEWELSSKGGAAAPLLHSTSAADMQPVGAATHTSVADEGAVLVGKSRSADLLPAEAADVPNSEEVAGGAAVLEELSAMTVGSHNDQQLQQL